MIDTLTVSLVDALASVVRRIRFIAIPGGITIELNEETASVDERIARLDDARRSLVAGLQAVDELRTEAKNNKDAVRRALEDLVKLEADKAELHEKVTKVRNLISTDVDAFREIAGIPSEQQRKRDKIIGFWAGVSASIVAAIILAVANFAWSKIPWNKTFSKSHESMLPLQETKR